jgi:transcriptional regulator with XRE-family HTH domain
MANEAAGAAGARGPRTGAEAAGTAGPGLAGAGSGAGAGAGAGLGAGAGAGLGAGAGAGSGAGSSGAPLEVIAASLRRERRRAGLSLTEVARRAGIAKSTLSQLESGAGNPSLETLWAICVALDAPFSRLLDPPRPRVQVIRAGEGPTVSAAQADYQATLLAACPPGARRDVYRISAEPGYARESQPHMPGVVEHVVLSAGRALVGVAGEPVELGPGDYVCYPADLPHVFEALEPGTRAVVVSEHV